MSLAIVLLFTFMALGNWGCEAPLDVENPNSVKEEDLNNPAGGTALANGASATVAQAAGHMLALYATATDEGKWIGSRDSWGQLDQGNVGDGNNEFTDAAWLDITEARFMSDKAVEKLSEFDAAGTIENREDLARAYLYSALIRVMVADVFDDFVISEPRTPAPSVGEDKMNTLYDQAVTNLDKALAITKNDELKARIIALRARAKNGKAIWEKVNPRGAPNNSQPYVSGGQDDAATVLGMVSADWRWQLEYSAVSPGSGNEYSWQVNGRKELDVVTPLPNDPIAGTVDPRIQRAVNEFKDIVTNGGANFARLTVVSAREMHLIIAESHIAAGNTAAARDEINVLRALDGLPAVTNEDAGLILQHERLANLFIQVRRLADMYRFGIKSPQWTNVSEAFTKPGSFFPITRREIEANPQVSFRR
jgi:hypothetical protein